MNLFAEYFSIYGFSYLITFSCLYHMLFKKYMVVCFLATTFFTKISLLLNLLKRCMLKKLLARSRQLMLDFRRTRRSVVSNAREACSLLKDLKYFILKKCYRNLEIDVQISIMIQGINDSSISSLFHCFCEYSSCLFSVILMCFPKQEESTSGRKTISFLMI